MKITEISWPVYKLKDTRPQEEDGVIFYFHSSSEKNILYIIDDKSIPGDTLALRRLQLKAKEAPLFKIKYSLFFLADLIKLAKKGTWFIDSTGKVFQYTKTVRAALSFHKISNVIRDIGCTLIEVEGSIIRHKSLFPPSNTQKYAGILTMGRIQILYGFYEEKQKTTYRKV